jgi:hypothetical protein
MFPNMLGVPAALDVARDVDGEPAAARHRDKADGGKLLWHRWTPSGLHQTLPNLFHIVKPC